MAAPNSQTTPNSQAPFSGIQQIGVISQTITPGSVGAANASGTQQTFTVTGLQTTDIIIVTPAATGNATTVGSAFVSAANTLAIQFNNPTAGALTPGAGVYLITVLRPAPGIPLLTAMPIL
jgi:hypothetical protein